MFTNRIEEEMLMSTDFEYIFIPHIHHFAIPSKLECNVLELGDWGGLWNPPRVQ